MLGGLKFWLMPLGSLALCFIPRWLGDKLADLLGRLSFLILRSRRAIVAHNLTQIMEAPSLQQIHRYTRQTFRNLARCIHDFLRIPHLKPKDWPSLVEFRGGEHLTLALQAGRGAILVTAHLGNWDLAGAFLAAMGYRVTAVVEPLGQGGTQTFNRYRGRTGMELVQLGEVFRLRRALRQNRILVLLGDRDLTHTGVEMQFFRGRRRIPLGPAWWALRLRSPLLTGYAVLAPEGKRRRYLVVVEPPLPVEPGSTVLSTTQALLDRITRAISSHPDQWFVFQPEWL